MILLFTSAHCMMCDMVKGMLEEEEADFGDAAKVYEVNVDRHPFIAEAYGVMVVPTLVAGCSTLCGVPCESELKSFLLQAAVGSPSQGTRKDLKSDLSSMCRSGRAWVVAGQSVNSSGLEPSSTKDAMSRRLSGKREHSKAPCDREENPDLSLQH